MNAKKKKTTRFNSAHNTLRCPRPAAAMEALEQRLLLSGTIISTLDALGNLTITGDLNPNNISIVKSDNTVTVTANDSETFAGTAGTTVGSTRVIPGVKGNIKVSLLGGADTLTIGEADSQFWVGDKTEFDAGTQSTPWNPKDLTIDMGSGLGDGADVLTLTAPVCRNLDIKTGAGNNTVTVQDNGQATLIDGSALVAGKLTITNGDDGCTIDLAGILVTRDATIAMGGGANSLTIREDTAVDGFDDPAPTFAPQFGGDLTITGGLGTDTVNLGSLATDPMSVNGDLSVSLGAAPALSQNSLTLAAVNVDGNFSYTGGAGADQVTVEQADLWVTGTIGLSMLAGDNSLDFTDLTIESVGDLTYTGGAGADTLTGGALKSARNITLTVGAGINDVTLAAAGDSPIGAGRNFTYSGTDGDDTLTLSGDNAWCGRDFTVKMGNGDNTFSFENLDTKLAAGRNLTYNGGAGVDDVIGDVGDGTGASLSVGSSATIALGAGESNSFSAVSDADSTFIIVQNLSVTGTTGSDTVSLSTESPIESTIGGKFALDLGAGENDLTVGGAGSLKVFGNFSYTGLGGNDTVTFQNEAMYILGDMTAKMGDGDNDLVLASFYANLLTGKLEITGNFTYNGGKGQDDVEADGSVFIQGDATIALGEGAYNYVSLYGDESTVNGALTCTAGAGDDTVQLDTQAKIYGNVAFRLGAGDNDLEVWGFTAGRNFTYEGGAGVDTLDCLALDVRRDTTIKTGDGNDIVAFYDGSSFNKFTLDTAGGADKAYLGDNAARDGQSNITEFDRTTVKGAMSIKMGAGDDEAYLGYDDTYLTFLSLDASVSIDGGAGTADKYDTGNVRFLFGPTRTGFEVIVP